MNIRLVIDKIHDGQLFVPEFQREYVWKRKHAKYIFDSLIKTQTICRKDHLMN